MGTIECAYCTAHNPVTRKSHRWAAGFDEVINVGGSASTTWDSQKVDCTLCHRKYTLITVTDYSWIKRKLLISGLALENLRAFGLSPDLDALFTHLPLITRIKKDTL